MESLPKSIVFITGTFLSNTCWDEWKLYFESNNYHCLAPAWPSKEASSEELRNRHPDTAIASLRLTDVMDYFTAVVSSLSDKPILIGHSLGGLIVQLLLERGLGMAGVAIHSFPPGGVGARFFFPRTIWKAMGFFTSTRETYMISFKRWKYTVANGMTCEQRKQLFYLYAVPESKLVVRDAFRSAARIKFDNVQAPLLFTAGGQDQIAPASLNYNNYRKYKMTRSITEFKEFKGHNHLVFGEECWRGEAEFILYWLEGLNWNNVAVTAHRLL